MAREKVTVTLDREKAERARQLTSASSISEVIDVALTELVKRQRTMREVELYLAMPQTEDELAFAGADPVELDDDTDWAAMYADVLSGAAETASR